MGHFGIQKKTPTLGKSPIKQENHSAPSTQTVDPRHADTCTR